MQRHGKHDYQLSLTEYLQFLRKLEIIPKILSIAFAFNLFAKLVPVYAKSIVKEGEDMFSTSLYYVNELNIDSHLFVHALMVIATSVEYPGIKVTDKQKVFFLLKFFLDRLFL